MAGLIGRSVEQPAADAGPEGWRATVGLRWLGAAVLVVLALGGTFVGQALTAGPGGWGHVGDGATPGSDSLDFTVNALNSDQPGLLLVGGSFNDAGGKPAADRIASWNGSTWSAVGSASGQLNGDVYAIAYANGNVYVGGSFTDVGGDTNAAHLAVWNGQVWAPFCGGAQHPFNGNVKALQIVGSTLYAGGEFLDAGGVTSADSLVACDLASGDASSTVTDTAHAFSGPVYALTADSNGVLYAGGGFTNLNTLPAADNVAYLAGGAWQAMGTGPAACGCAVSTFVRSLTAIGPDVYVGTDANDVAGLPRADKVARWSATAWSAVGSDASGQNGWFPTVSGSIDALTSFGSMLFAAGSFQNAGGDQTADNVAVYDGTSWQSLGSNGSGDGALPAKVNALAVFDRQAAATDPRSLFAGGSFTSASGDTQANRLASFSLAALTPVATLTPTPGATAVPTPVATPTPMPVPAPTPTPTPDITAPTITALRLSRTTFRAAPSGGPFRAARAAVGTDVSFTLSEPGSVRFTIDRSASGRSVRSRCVKPSGKNRGRPRCTRWLPVKGSFTVTGKRGLNRIELRGRIGGRTLAPGRYRLNARETDRAANQSRTKRTPFTIVR